MKVLHIMRNHCSAQSQHKFHPHFYSNAFPLSQMLRLSLHTTVLDMNLSTCNLLLTKPKKLARWAKEKCIQHGKSSFFAHNPKGLTTLAPESSFVHYIINVTFLKTMNLIFSPYKVNSNGTRATVSKHEAY
jgi:hypothetical protein